MYVAVVPPGEQWMSRASVVLGWCEVLIHSIPGNKLDDLHVETILGCADERELRAITNALYLYISNRRRVLQLYEWDHSTL
jgi:hypothetical protein